MSITTLILWALALAAFGLALRGGGAPRGRRALRETGETLAKVLPIFAVALPMASFLAELIPQDIAQGWLGPESGIAGLLIAAVAGGLIPGGPFISFPLVLTFAKAGAGTAQMVALLTGWGIYGFHRILTWEYPLLGGRFVALRWGWPWARA